METQFVQELKSERVQEEMAMVPGEEPYTVALKSERVQEPASFAGGGLESTQTAVVELSLNRVHPVTVELLALQTVITLHGAQSPDQAE